MRKRIKRWWFRFSGGTHTHAEGERKPGQYCQGCVDEAFWRQVAPTRYPKRPYQ